MGRVAGIALLAAAALAGCGGSDHKAAKAASSTQAAKTASSTRANAPELIWLKRVTATPDPVADDLTIRADGSMLYRLGLGGHGAGRGVARDRLSPARLSRLRDLIEHAHLSGRRNGAPVATPGGYYYTLYVRGTTYATSSGHVPATVKPLVSTLDRIALRLDTEKLEFGHTVPRSS